MEFTINQYSAASAILVFIGFISFKIYMGQAIILPDIILACIAGGMLPFALCFVAYPFFPNLIDSIENKSLQITLTGLVLIYVYLKTIIENINSS